MKVYTPCPEHTEENNMNAPQQVVVSPDVEIQMQEALTAQRGSYLAEGYVSAEARIDRINRAIDVLVRHASRISEAINQDFVCRPDQINLMTDVASSIGSMKHCRSRLKKWMKADRRPSTFPLGFLGGRSKVHYQP
jgi:coniferyl-aldehyde dehydrogenase